MTNPMRVVCSVLTNQIYASRVNLTNNTMTGEKEDVTESAVSAVAMHLHKSGMDVLFDDQGKKYRLTVVEEPSHD